MATEAQLIEGIRRADAAGDSDGVKALGAALIQMRGQAKQNPKPKPKERSTLADLGSATANVMAGMGQNATSLIDAGTNAMAGAMRYGVHGLGAGAAGIARATGNEGTARNIEAGTSRIDRGLANPVTLGGLIEKAVPTPQDTAGKVARFGAQMVGNPIGMPKAAAAATKVPLGPAATELAAKRVRMTPGQIAREKSGTVPRMVASIEDRMTSLPGPTGTRVIAGRERAGMDFVRGALQDSLDEIGVKLPAGTKAGHDAVRFTQKAAGDAYDKALSRLTIKADQQLSDDVTKIATDARGGGLTGDFLAKFEKTVENVVLRRIRANGGKLDGDTLKTTISELRKTEGKYAGTTGSESEYGDAVGAIADALEDAAIRSSPKEVGAALKAADRAYAKLVRIETAARNARGGVFTPAQLSTAVRQTDRSARKRAVAAGEGLMQGYAEAGQTVLPSRIGSSGTAERQGLFNPIAWGLDAAAYVPYRMAEKRAANAMAGKASSNAMARGARRVVKGGTAATVANSNASRE